MSAFEEDLFDDLAYEEAEGSAALFDDGFDAFDEDDEALFDDADDWDSGDDLMGDGFAAYDSSDDFDELEGDGFELMDELDEFDDMESDDDFESDEAEDLFDSAIAYALDSEDTDEFFKKLWSGIKKVARKAAPIIGKVARVAAPILSKIPTPYTQAAGMAARLLGKLRAEGASEEEALEAFAELAVKRPAALPVVAGLTARTVLKRAGTRMSTTARKRAVKDAKSAAKLLIRKRGPAAVRAMPKIAKAVRRQAAAKRTPPAARTKVVKRAAAKVARSADMTRKLSRPCPRAKRLVLGTWGTRASTRIIGATRTLTVPGPARITIKSL